MYNAGTDILDGDPLGRCVRDVDARLCDTLLLMLCCMHCIESARHCIIVAQLCIINYSTSLNYVRGAIKGGACYLFFYCSCRFNVSKEGIQRRDEMVFEACLKVRNLSLESFPSSTSFCFEYILYNICFISL